MSVGEGGISASELFRAGQLGEAVAAQIQEVKSRPADQARRLFLFELLAFAGDLDRARKQIDVVQYSDPELDAATANYRSLLEAEGRRRRLFADGVEPKFFVDPPEHVRLRLQAAAAARADTAEAGRLLQRAEELTPPIAGQLNGQPFAALRDADDLLGPVLEVMAHGDYYWVSLEQVEAVAAPPPKFPRDLLWLPAQLVLRDGAAGNVFLPTLYAGSHEHADDQVKLGRKTEWIGPEGGPVRGLGLRTFLVNDDARTLLEWREFQVGDGQPAHVPGSTAADAGPPAGAGQGGS